MSDYKILQILSVFRGPHAEKEWLKCKVAFRKSTLKYVYISTRKEFDRLVQMAKRIHWFNIQAELLRETENNDVEFWKSIGKVGIAQAGDKRIPMEVVLDGGRVDSKFGNCPIEVENRFLLLI